MHINLPWEGIIDSQPEGDTSEGMGYEHGHVTCKGPEAGDGTGVPDIGQYPHGPHSRLVSRSATALTRSRTLAIHLSATTPNVPRMFPLMSC